MWLAGLCMLCSVELENNEASNRETASRLSSSSVVCLTIGQITSCKASSAHSAIWRCFSYQNLFVSLSSSSSCLRLLSRPPMTMFTSIFPPITCFRRQFLRKMWPIQLAFFLFIVCRIFLSPLSLNWWKYFMSFMELRGPVPWSRFAQRNKFFASYITGSYISVCT